MTIDDVVESQSLKPAQLLQMGFVLLVVVAATLVLAFRQHNQILLAAVLAFCTVILPALYLLAKRLQARIKHQHLESTMAKHTKAFLSTQEPAVWRTVIKELDPETLGERLLTAFKMDDTALFHAGFQALAVEVPPPGSAEPTLCEPLSGEAAADFPTQQLVRLKAMPEPVPAAFV